MGLFIFNICVVWGKTFTPIPDDLDLWPTFDFFVKMRPFLHNFYPLTWGFSYLTYVLLAARPLHPYLVTLTFDLLLFFTSLFSSFPLLCITYSILVLKIIAVIQIKPQQASYVVFWQLLFKTLWKKCSSKSSFPQYL